MLDRSISISVYAPPDSARTPPSKYDTTISELIASLVEAPEPVARKQDAPAWSPIVYRGARRVSVDAERICALVYDLDNPEFDLSPVEKALHTYRWVYAVHSTWTEGCARLVIPLASDVLPSVYADLRETIASCLGLVHDPACSDLARLFYAPSCPPGSERPAGETGGTVLLNPTDFVKGGYSNLLRTERNTTPREPSKSDPPAESLPKIFDLSALREDASKHNVPETRKRLLDLIDGTLVIPPGTRETMLHPLLGSLSHLRHAPGEEGCELLLRRVLARRDGADQHLEEWVDKALYSYTRGESHKEVLDQQAAVVEKFFRDEKWREKLKQKISKDGAVLGLLPIEANVCDVLQNDPAFAGHVRWNLLKQNIEVTGGVLAKEPVESLDVPAAVWFQKSEYNCPASRELIGACVQHVALHHPYDPVREYLLSLPKWDGKKRLSRLLLDYAHAKGAPEWVEIITRKFFVAAIARALRPGCQVDNVLVLQGDQGGGKTSLVRVMGAGFHVETNLDLHSKDAVMVSASAWMVELGELASLKRSDVESVRNFITRKEDSIRLPYGRAVKSMPRRCVFVGTTNSKQPLTDPEGNRRWWVVSVGSVRVKELELVRDQLWAEALAAFNAGEEWWLSPEEAERAKQEASVYETEDVYQTEILSWLEEQRGKKWPEVLFASEVATKILKMIPGSLSPQLIAAINRTMGNMGWARTRRRRGGQPMWCYRVPSMRAMYSLDTESDKVTMDEESEETG